MSDDVAAPVVGPSVAPRSEPDLDKFRAEARAWLTRH
jgi:hypothetical protein